MSPELALLLLTAALAVIAVVAALVAVRASRRPAPAHVEVAADPPIATSTELACVPAEPVPVPRIVEGRFVVPPTSQQIVTATMGRPLVRLSVISHGIAHALRPESRDRIVALMRREFRSRRRQRTRVARHAARLAHPIPPQAVDRRVIASEAWLGELPPLEPSTSESRAVES